MKAGFAARAPIRIRFMLTAMKNKHVQQEEAAWPIDLSAGLAIQRPRVQVG